MKAFMERMDSRFQAQENALRDISNKNLQGDAGGKKQGYRRRKKNTSKYCWTHEACAHDSMSCNNKAAGHKDNATFCNKYGDSTKFCNPQE